jgi:hypothetical protein
MSRPIFIGVLSVALGVTTLLSPIYRSISDKALIANFIEHEQSFERLRLFAAADSDYALISPRAVTKSTPRIFEATLASSEHGGLSDARYTEYLALFKALRLDDGILRDGRRIWFNSVRPTFFGGGSAKVYVFSLDELSPLTADLDAFVPPRIDPLHGRPGFLVFRRLNPHWYLFRHAF